MSTAVLDREDLRRTLVRVAHEIIERNGDDPVAIVGIHTRGALIAGRLRRLIEELLGRPVPLGEIDISFYRDDEIDLSELLREQFYLALPMKPLCREDCRGLCPQCGVNRNTGTCDCGPGWDDRAG